MHHTEHCPAQGHGGKRWPPRTVHFPLEKYKKVSPSPSNGDITSFFFKFPSLGSVNLLSRMTSTTQTLQAHDFPFSFETLWNIDFSNVGAYPQDSTSEVMDLGVEELSSKFANEETQEPPTEDSQETKKTSLALSGTGHPTIDIGGSSMEQTSTPLIQACPDRAGEIAAEVWPNYCSQKLAEN